MKARAMVGAWYIGIDGAVSVCPECDKDDETRTALEREGREWNCVRCPSHLAESREVNKIQEWLDNNPVKQK